MKLILIILWTLIPLRVLGQNHFVGIKTGLNWTNIASSNFVNDNDSRTGISAGISYEYFFTKRISISADLIYSQRGFSNTVKFTDSNGNLTGQTSTLKFNYDYLSIPIKLGYTIGNKAFGFTNVGLIPSLIIDAKTKNLPVFGGTTDVTNKVNKFDIAGLVEIGGGYKFGKYWLYSSMTYQQSFTTLTNADYFANSTVKHYGLTLSLGVKYSLGKE